MKKKNCHTLIGNLVCPLDNNISISDFNLLFINIHWNLSNTVAELAKKLAFGTLRTRCCPITSSKNQRGSFCTNFHSNVNKP